MPEPSGGDGGDGADEDGKLGGDMAGGKGRGEFSGGGDGGEARRHEPSSRVAVATKFDAVGSMQPGTAYEQELAACTVVSEV